MDDKEKQFENFVRQINFDDTPDPNHRERLERDLLRALAKQAHLQIKVWRTIMRSPITKLAAAVVMVIALIVWLHEFGGSVDVASVAWGQVAERVEKIPAVTYRRIVIDPQGTLGSSIREEMVYLSDHRIRVDSFPKGGVNPHFHWISIDMSTHTIRVHEYGDDTQAPYGGVLVYMDDSNRPSSDPGMDIDENFAHWVQERNVDLDKYQSQGYRSWCLFLGERVRVDSGGRHLLSEEEAVKWYKHRDPREWVKEALSLHYKELGCDNIGGVEVEGVEVTGRNLSVAPYFRFERDVIIRFWVDVKTGLPVRYEARGRFGRWEGDWAMVVDEIRWDQNVDPNIFEPNVPVE